MYVEAKNNSIVALDAATGREIWVHPNNTRLITARGINYWESKDRSDRRLLYCADNYLVAIDARTGQSIPSFGENGRSDLRAGYDRDPKTLTRVQNGTPGRVFENLIILGSASSGEYESAPGLIRAFDVRTGKLVWVFHTIPHPGEFGYDTWPKDAWKTVGGDHNWSELTLDEKRGIVYVPLASPNYDFYGGNRKGANLFGDCLLALDARTGKRLWHFQLVHHDLWDYDAPAAPKLLTVRHNGKTVEAVAQPTKMGFLFVFDRVTGKPIWPIEERPVPQSSFEDEHTSPTQPFPTVVPPFSRQSFTVKDIDPYILTDKERAGLQVRVAAAHNGPLFTPPAMGDTIEMPGNRGGSNWGTTSANPAKGYVYVAGYDAPAILHMTDEAPGAPVAVAASSGAGNTGLELYSQNCAMCHGAMRTGEIGPSLVDIKDRLSLDAIRAIIRNGQGQMPSFSGMSQEKVDSIAEYIYDPNLKMAPGGFHMPKSDSEVNGPDDESDVVGSGGAPAGLLAPGAKLNGAGPYGSMAGLPYPAGVQAPKRYYTNWNVMPTIIDPPWTSLVAYDLNKGNIKWKVPLGDDPQLSPKGILNTGIRQEQRGILVTATGLVFVGTSDGKLRAFDDDNGKQIWSSDLPQGNRAVPAIYEVNGREYLMVSATTRVGAGVGSGAGGASMPLPPPSPNDPKPAYVVFALPQKADTK